MQYWLSVCVITIWYFLSFGNAGLQCRSAIPERSAKPIASIHHSVEYLWETPCLTCLCMQKQKYSVHVISWIFQVDFTTFVLFSYPVIASTFMKNLSKCCRYYFPNFSNQFLAGFCHLKPLSRRQWRDNSCCRCAAKESKNSLHLLAAILALGFVFSNLKTKVFSWNVVKKTSELASLGGTVRASNRFSNSWQFEPQLRRFSSKT